MSALRQQTGNPSLFDENPEILDTDVSKMKVVRVQDLEIEVMEKATDLFDGFKEMRAITWSYGLSEVVKQMKKFEHVELVFGCRRLVEKDIKASALVPVLLQAELIKELVGKNGQYIADRIEEGTCSLYFEQTIASHQKLYLLSDEAEGRYRVIFGSANFSRTAWKGDKQKEIIAYCDGYNCYQQFLNKIYIPFRQTCSDHITDLKAKIEKITKIGHVDLDDIPYLNNGKTSNSIIIIEPADYDDADFPILSLTDSALYGGISKTNFDRMQGYFSSVDGGRRYLLDSRNLIQLKVEGRKINAEKETEEKVCPKLRLDFDQEVVTLNGKILSTENYLKDAELFVKYIDSFDCFSGDVEQYKNDIWKLSVWYFMSPFFSYLRNFCIKEQETGRIISMPMFAILYGNANAGKTALFQFLGKAMSGIAINPLPGKDFKDGSIPKEGSTVRANASRHPRLMQLNQEGLPILYDDVAQSNLNESSLRKLLTTPYERTLDENYPNYPAIVATSNIHPHIETAFQKRAFFFEASASLNQIEAISNGSIPQSLTDEIGPSFFAMFCARVFPIVKEEATHEGIRNIDVYKIASSVLIGILEECGERPKWAVSLELNDYHGEYALSLRGVNSLKRFFVANPECFERKPKEDELIIRYPAENKGMEKELTSIKNILPPKCKASISPGMLTLALDATEKCSGIVFKRSWLQKLRHE